MCDVCILIASSFVATYLAPIAQGGPPVPRDMKYNLFNIDRQRNNFESMKAVVDKDLMNDVYARDGDTDTFWFVGKVARVSGA
jgi:carbamate kinase